ncbi:MAG: restriction endonuclease [Candidatus Cloacimonetes bacterium]|jgi:hypothetical protein|nr:restriction endonuclease [Candidatus Cloacimonadota bacterium]
MFFFSNKAREIEATLKKIEDLNKSAKQLNDDNKRMLDIIEERERGLLKLEAEKSQGFPWLANAISEYHYFLEFALAYYLENKKHRATKAAEEVRRISRKNKVLQVELKTTKYILEYYESLFPWLKDYLGEDRDEFIKEVSDSTSLDDDDSDPVSKYFPASEYEKLSVTERNQLALDKYKKSKKSPYLIGRDYERYIGYLYESQGYSVEYSGISFGLQDMGRDLICKKDAQIKIVQCKCWSAHKTIHEKHINQLYGTTVKYYIDTIKRKSVKKLAEFPDLIKSEKIKAVFVTATNLSETAWDFANALGIQVRENEKLQDYPMIKCNINAKHEKIYHLPFDQQYDKTQIDKPGEFYAYSVKEAESQGFRRAYRWKGLIHSGNPM